MANENDRPIINAGVDNIIATATDIKNDLSTLRPLLRNMLFNAYATDKIENTPIASFPDGADNIPVKSATFAITPVQDLHGYDNPWPAGGGKNLFDKDNINALNAYISDEMIVNGGARTIYILCKPNTTYTVSKTLGARLLARYTKVLPAIGVGTLGGADPTGTALKYTVTTGADAQYIVAYVYNSSIDAGLTFEQIANTIQIEEGSIATAWTPYSNTCPITGFTGAEITDRGKNWYDASTYPTTTLNGVTCTNNGDGSFTLNGTATSDAYFNVFSTQFNAILGGTPLPTDTYRLTGCPSGGGYSSYDLYTLPNYHTDLGSGSTFTDGVTGGSIFIKNGYTCNNLVFKPMIRLASQGDDTFAPFVGATHDITWSDEAGTVYGGTLQYLGGDAWRLTKTMQSVDMGTPTWTRIDSGYGFYRFIATISDKKMGNSNLVCSIYATETEELGGNQHNCTIKGSNADNRVLVRDDRYTDVQAFATAVTGQTLCYELATPVTYDLTGEELATVLGNNNVFSSTGDVTELVYRADVAKYIEKKLAE